MFGRTIALPQRARGVLMISATLIVPACNYAPILAPTLTALQSQTTGNYDIIALDDGSTDDTLEVAQRFIGPQLSVMACRRRGIIAARNAGPAETDADAVGFCDPGDV
ncbi:MAG: glycosyltransferase family 2 protein [Rhodobacterales bacterium]